MLYNIYFHGLRLFLLETKKKLRFYLSFRKIRCIFESR